MELRSTSSRGRGEAHLVETGDNATVSRGQELEQRDRPQPSPPYAGGAVAGRVKQRSHLSDLQYTVVDGAKCVKCAWMWWKGYQMCGNVMEGLGQAEGSRLTLGMVRDSTGNKSKKRGWGNKVELCMWGYNAARKMPRKEQYHVSNHKHRAPVSNINSQPSSIIKYHISNTMVPNIKYQISNTKY